MRRLVCAFVVRKLPKTVCNCSMFCCTLLYVHSRIAIILMGKRELIALLNLSSWCLVMVERLFLAVSQGCLQFVIVVFPDHTHLLFFSCRDPFLKDPFSRLYRSRAFGTNLHFCSFYVRSSSKCSDEMKFRK